MSPRPAIDPTLPDIPHDGPSHPYANNRSVDVMKPLAQTGRYLRRCVGAFVLAASCLGGPATAQNEQLDSTVKQLAADVQAVALARHGRWIELPTGGWSTRHFVAELHRSKNDNAVLAQLRVDYIGATADGTASVVQTAWLYCDAGQKRVVAARGYDAEGRQTFATDTPDAAAQRIESLYAGTEQLICSEQYLLLDVADGYQRLGNLLLLRRALRSSNVPDRPIPNR